MQPAWPFPRLGGHGLVQQRLAGGEGLGGDEEGQAEGKGRGGHQRVGKGEEEGGQQQEAATTAAAAAATTTTTS